MAGFFAATTLVGALAGVFAAALAGAVFLAGSGFLGAGFFATGLAAAFDLFCLAVSFGMSILGWNAFRARRCRQWKRRDWRGQTKPARAESA
ncbi:MAG: hypothetical protein Q8J99_00695, partial [Sulfuritalea sp.]|nr:hypothetical protein [Sulfuritalea sp.]